MQGTHPSGQTPNAKRVRARDEDRALQPPAASMTVDSLSDGFHTLFAQVQIGPKFAEDMGEAVTYKLSLLNALIGRTNALEAAAAIQTQRIEGEIIPKIAEVASGVENLDLTTGQLTSDVKRCFGVVEA